MRFQDPSVLAVSSEILANISAGWFGLVLITPNFSTLEFPAILIPLLIHIGFGILFACGAIMLRRLIKV